MNSVEKQVALIALERRILRTICAGGIPREALDAAISELVGHAWRAPEHRIVWEALMRIPGADVASLSELLPAEATRMGFPDVNWESYFAADCSSTKELDAMVRQLLNGDPEVQ